LASLASITPNSPFISRIRDQIKLGNSLSSLACMIANDCEDPLNQVYDIIAVEKLNKKVKLARMLG
jgi:hypothetical protein